jgi:hypothetical protein
MVLYRNRGTLSVNWFHKGDDKNIGFEVLTAVSMKNLSSGIYRRVVRWKSTDVSEEDAASIFTVENMFLPNVG